MIVAIYSRKSKFTGKGESIGNQIELCKEYCKNNLRDKNVTDFLIYEDEGFSGKNIERPKFKEMLANAKAKKFDILICYRLDRVSRNVADFSVLINKLQEYEIEFISIREQFDTTTPMGRAMMYIASVFAQLERETIAERIRDNMLELAKTGRWLGGQTPLGFKSEKVTYMDSEKERYMYMLSPIADELECVNLIYAKYLETGSISLTLKHLLTFNIKGKNGGDFASMSVNDILRNPVYVRSNNLVFEYLSEKGMQVCGVPNGNGILIYNKAKSNSKRKNVAEWIASVGKHKGIIDGSKWLQVQIQLDKNSKKDSPRQGTSKKSLLSGILKCGICGAPMRISYGRPKKDGSERIYYYMCTMKAHSGKTRCSNPNVRGDQLEKLVIDNLKKINKETILTELEIYKKSLSKNIPTKNIKDEITVKNNQMNNLISRLSNITNEIACNSIILKIDELGEEIKRLQSELNNLEESKNYNVKKELEVDMLIDLLKKFNTTFDSIKDISQKRVVLETIIDRIEWNGINQNVDITLWGSKKKDKKLQYNKPTSCVFVRCQQNRTRCSGLRKKNGYRSKAHLQSG